MHGPYDLVSERRLLPGCVLYRTAFVLLCTRLALYCLPYTTCAGLHTSYWAALHCLPCTHCLSPLVLYPADLPCLSCAAYLAPCLHAVCVPVELGLRDVPDDQKVNLGASLLRCTLSKWAHAFSSLHMSGAPLPGLDEPGAEQMPRFSSDMPPAGEGRRLGGVGRGGGTLACD